MENMSVNALVDSYASHLPREISLNVAKDVMSKFCLLYTSDAADE